MQPYLDLLRDVRQNGVRRPTRAKLQSTGQHVDALSVFGRQVRYDLRAGFPLVTTKHTSFGSIVHELIWFLRGDTNVRYLEENGVYIWSDWKDEDGDLGPIYGSQFRAWPSARDGGEVDQIADLLEGIRKAARDPFAACRRRLVLSAWNVADLWRMALPPCHCMSIFNVADGKLSCMLVQRSGDAFLGIPYNVASYALLTHVLAAFASLEVGELIHSLGDAHIYRNHLDQVDEQLSREPLPLPSLKLDLDGLTHPWDVTRDRIEIVDYVHHPALRGEVAV